MEFREMRRRKQMLTEQECEEILKKEPRGVLAVLGDNDYPYAIPMNHFYDAAEKKLYFHGAGTGHKHDAIAKHDKVCFCVYDKGFRREGEWALNIKSIVVFGRLKRIESQEKCIEVCRKLGQKHYPNLEDVEHEIMKDGPRVTCLELTVDHMTGKLVNES